MHAALGFRVHSGWAVMIAMGDPMQVLERRRIVCIDESVDGAKQPYHFAEKLEIGAAQRHIAECTSNSDRFAKHALASAVRDISRRDFEIAGAAIVEASGRPLPDLPRILLSHALIHAAEGEFFRDVFRRACQSAGLPVLSIAERDLNAAPESLRKSVNDLGRTLGPPWTQDQKLAAMAACMVLSYRRAASV